LGSTYHAEKTAKESLVSNLAIAIAKLAAALLTGSIGLMAETIHSLSDTLNQAFVLIGIHKSKKGPDKKHPFGYGKERFLWPFLVATLLFSLAGIFSTQVGLFPMLQDKYEPLRNVEVGYIVLAASGILEAKAFNSAFSLLKKDIEARGQRADLRALVSEFKENKEPARMTVIVEDAVAIFGVAVTALGIFLSKTIGHGVYDSASAIAVGVALLGFAFFLTREFKDLLVGRSASEEELDKINNILSKMPRIKAVKSIKTMHLSTEDILIAIELALKNGEEDSNDRMNHTDADHVIDIADNIEHQIKQIMPQIDISKIYIKYV
jgi:cation diffusion facilitator family transporter